MEHGTKQIAQCIHSHPCTLGGKGNAAFDQPQGINNSDMLHTEFFVQKQRSPRSAKFLSRRTNDVAKLQSAPHMFGRKIQMNLQSINTENHPNEGGGGLVYPQTLCLHTKTSMYKKKKKKKKKNLCVSKRSNFTEISG